MEAFIGQLKVVAFNFAPNGWALCTGQLMSISQNTALFALLGVNFGGDGRVTFGLPNLQGNIPVGVGTGPGLSSYELGEQGGAATVTLNTTEMPAHTHNLMAAVGRGVNSNAQSALGNSIGPTQGAAAGTPYLPAATLNVAMSPGAVLPAGSSQPHKNMMPYVALNFIISLGGIFPQRP